MSKFFKRFHSSKKMDKKVVQFFEVIAANKVRM